MKKCLICEAAIEPCVDFGMMPIANGFLLPEQYSREYFFPLQLAFCPRCSMVQLLEQPDREQMFNEHYAFFSGTSKGMALHFEAMARMVMDGFLGKDDPFVVEIGSNDGIMLQHFARRSIRHLGIEPSANVAEAAREKGVQTISEFFDAALAKKIVNQWGHADAFLAANVMCHIPYLHSVVEGMGVLLKPGGVVIFEDPYLGDVLEKTSYDQIYDEHVFLFSVTSLRYLFAAHGMEVVDCLPQPTHGGSMRYFVARKGERPVSPRVAEQLEKERTAGLLNAAAYEAFGVNCERSRRQLRELLVTLKREGKRVAGYAATSKSTTILNYCGITPDLLSYISDTTPIKQGKYSPGMHIPILPYEAFVEDYPDYALLFGWNHRAEIMAKERPFRAAGGRWIVYVPEVQIIA
jgi:methylation protein EvaC